MATIRTNKLTPKSPEETKKLLEEINLEFNVDMTNDSVKATNKLSDFFQKKKTLVHYPQIEDQEKINEKPNDGKRKSF